MHSLVQPSLKAGSSSSLLPDASNVRCGWFPCMLATSGMKLVVRSIMSSGSNMMATDVSGVSITAAAAAAAAVRSFEAFERQYAADHSWESLQEDEQGFLRPLVSSGG